MSCKYKKKSANPVGSAHSYQIHDPLIRNPGNQDGFRRNIRILFFFGNQPHKTGIGHTRLMVVITLDLNDILESLFVGLIKLPAVPFGPSDCPPKRCLRTIFILLLIEICITVL